MTMRGMMLAGAAMLALAACGTAEQPVAEANAMGGNVTTPAVAPTLPEPTVNEAAATVAPAEDGAIPAAYRGRWGMTANDCDPKMDYVAKGLMAVEAERLAFYESRARVTEAKADGADRLALKLAFTGEGQAWTVDSTFALEDGGKALVRTDRGDQPGTFRYERCPA